MKIEIKRNGKKSSTTTSYYCCDEMCDLIQNSAAVAIHLKAKECRITKVKPEVIHFCPYCGSGIVFENIDL